MAEVNSSKKETKISEEAEMSFWDHLEELRWTFIRSAIAVVVLAILAFIGRRIVFDGIIMGPNSPHFVTNRFFCWFGDLVHVPDLCMHGIKMKIINLNMSGQFTTHLNISIIAGLILAVPYIVWEIWRFLKPALKPNERKYSRLAVFVISFLFLLGVCFGYFVIVPLTINFFGNYQVSAMVENQIALTSYISTVTSVTFANGVVFELPVFVYFLTRVGILKPAFLKKTRRYAIVIVLTLSAVFTPPDVFSQILVSIPLYGLYELSIRVSERVLKKKDLAG
jgi:sec-independent protein translocase protein TatC